MSSSSRCRSATGDRGGGWVVRSVTREDLQALDAELPEEWNIGKPAGYAAERNGELVATGQVTWDRYGHVWGWFNNCERVPAIIMHRCALEMLRLLRECEEARLYMICDLDAPGAEKWVRRLGFVPDDTMKHPLGPVFRCDL